MGRVGLSRVVAQPFLQPCNAAAWTLLPSVLAALGADSLFSPFLCFFFLYVGFIP
jgi:hypothetical protein